MDREKVIKAIECCVVNRTRCFDDNDKLCPYFSTKVYMCENELLKDALALLKEQEDRIKNRDESLEKAREEIKWLRGMMKEQEAVVRCMYCKRRGTYDCPVYVGGDGTCSEPDDWFCADGERK